jgi:hypothetical protein
MTSRNMQATTIPARKPSAGAVPSDGGGVPGGGGVVADADVDAVVDSKVTAAVVDEAAMIIDAVVVVVALAVVVAGKVVVVVALAVVVTGKVVVVVAPAVVVTGKVVVVVAPAVVVTGKVVVVVVDSGTTGASMMDNPFDAKNEGSRLHTMDIGTAVEFRTHWSMVCHICEVVLKKTTVVSAPPICSRFRLLICPPPTSSASVISGSSTFTVSFGRLVRYIETGAPRDLNFSSLSFCISKDLLGMGMTHSSRGEAASYLMNFSLPMDTVPLTGMM